ncbi:MAG: prohibitin family protein [Lachnospiraceae bacterium]|nr:prohibitin family protein [Lachnospiraceae bacterium]MBR4414959.1 prohibitin family protein [Aeriscardovia sp.]
MIAFVIGIIATIVAFIVLGIDFGEYDLVWGLKKRQVFSLLGLIICLLGFIKTVPTGSTGIVTTFGRIENVSLDAGIHFMAPWKKVVNMDNRTQKQSIEMPCFSSDIQEVNVIYTVNYQINKANAQEIYRTIGKDYFDTIVMPKALEAVKSVFAKYTAEALVESRSSLSKEIEAILVDDLNKQNIQITATSIENIDFTDAFTNAVEAKQVAEQNKLKAQTEQAQATLEAQAQAERQVIKAQADADASILAAKADAEVAKISSDSALYQGEKEASILQRVGEQLAKYPDLVKYKYIEGWDGKMPQTILGNSDVIMDMR